MLKSLGLEKEYIPKIWIDYPQEEDLGKNFKYHCKFCGVSTLIINGYLENHAIDCEYRISKVEDKTFE